MCLGVFLKKASLVRANYSDLTNGITETTEYLESFFRSMLLGEKHDLRNRIMHVDWKKVEGETLSKVQIIKFKVQKLAKNYLQSAKIALWTRLHYFA